MLIAISLKALALQGCKAFLSYFFSHEVRFSYCLSFVRYIMSNNLARF